MCFWHSQEARLEKRRELANLERGLALLALERKRMQGHDEEPSAVQGYVR